MSDPRRLIDGSSSRLVIELLAAGRLEGPAPELVERFLQTAPLGLAAGVVVERLISTTTELGASQAVASGSAASSAVAAPATAGSAPASANLVAGSTAASVASVGGASGVTAGVASGAASGSLVHGGAVTVGLMKGGAASALVKSGTAAAALVKWVGVGVVGLAAAAGTPKLLHWVDQRNSGIGAAASTTARIEATPVSAAAVPRSSTPGAAPLVEPAEAAQLAEPARVVDRGAAPRGERLERPAVAERATRPNPLVDSKSRPGPAAASPAAPPPHSPGDSKGRQVPAAASPPAPPLDSLVVPPPAREKHPSMDASPAPAELDSNTDFAPIAAPPSTLSFELASVDRARAALARGDARQTLHELAGHERRYPKGQLELEVSVLRMEAHVQRGDLPAARELARRILAGPVSPLHARRARQVLEGQISPR